MYHLFGKPGIKKAFLHTYKLSYQMDIWMDKQMERDIAQCIRDPNAEVTFLMLISRIFKVWVFFNPITNPLLPTGFHKHIPL